MVQNEKKKGRCATYTTVGTVGASPALGSLVHLDVLDDQVASVETLAIGVGFGVLQEVHEELGGLDGPAGLADFELLAWIDSQLVVQPGLKFSAVLHPSQHINKPLALALHVVVQLASSP